MPEPSRRKRAPEPALPKRRDVYTEADGLFGRIADIVIENPVRSGGFVMVIMAAGAIISNAAYFQTAHHPAPLFATRDASAVSVPAAPVAKAGTTTAMPAEVDATKAPPLPLSAPSSGSLVADTQAALAAINLYDGPVDGKFGQKTRAAISAFETKMGITPTGQPSARLLLQIRKSGPHASAEEPATEDPVATGSIDTAATVARIRKVQAALNDIGYGPLRVDGKGGGATSDAIRRFELDNGLTLTGDAGDAVIGKLVKIGAMKPI